MEAAAAATATMAATVMLVETVALETAEAGMAKAVDLAALETLGAALLEARLEVAQETAMAVAEGMPMAAALVAAWAVDLAGM